MQKLARNNESLLRPIERRFIALLIRHMPAWMAPDKLTAIGVFGAALAAIFYPMTILSPHYVWVASFGIVMNWFGDSLDGSLARERKIEKPLYGLFVDHTADLVSQVLIGLGFGFGPNLGLASALIVLVTYLVFAAYTFIRALVFKQVQIAYFGSGPTEIRIILIFCGISLAYFTSLSHPVILNLGLSDLIAFAFAAIGLAAFCVKVFSDWRILRTLNNI